MELSLYLARAWGLFIVIVCVALIFNKDKYTKMIKTIKADDPLLFISAFFAVGLGAAQIVGYNVWTSDWRGIVTLFGWASLFKGLGILFMPQYTERFGKLFVTTVWYWTLVGIFLLAGIYLMYAGFTG